MSEIFFTSDTHFSHANVMQHYAHRECLGSVENQVEHMVEIWNTMIRPKDTVYHIGDFGGPDYKWDLRIIRRLNGRIHYVPGNHDRKLLRERAFHDRCSIVYPYSYAEVSIDRQKIVLSHYPFWEWNQMHRGYWHLHGHLHGRTHGIPGKIKDVGADGNNLKPYHFEEIKAWMDAQPLRAHHKQIFPEDLTSKS